MITMMAAMLAFAWVGNAETVVVSDVKGVWLGPDEGTRHGDVWYNTRMKSIAADISNFEELRKAGQTYVDKTAYFHRLIAR